MVPNPDVLARRLGDEMVLVSISTDQIYSLNRTGADFWELTVSGLSEDAVCRELLSRYDIEEEALRAEITQLTEQLVAEQLLLPNGAA